MIYEISSWLARFRAEDKGAVTVDFVVVTAAIVALSVAVLGAIGSGATDLADDTGETIAKFELWGLAEPPRE